jgi:hypothetical protein
VLHHREHVHQRAVRQPGRDRDTAARTAHAGQLRGGGLGPCGEHDAERRGHGIERPRLERQVLGVTDAVRDRQPFLARPPLGGVEQSAGDVGADHGGATPREQPRGPPGAGGEVQDALARLRIEAAHAVLDGIGDAAADLLVIRSAGTPHGGRALVVLLNRGWHRHSLSSMGEGSEEVTEAAGRATFLKRRNPCPLHRLDSGAAGFFHLPSDRAHGRLVDCQSRDSLGEG